MEKPTKKIINLWMIIVLTFFIGFSSGLVYGIGFVGSYYDSHEWVVQKMLYETEQLNNKSEQILSFNTHIDHIMFKLWKNRISVDDKENIASVIVRSNVSECWIEDNGKLIKVIKDCDVRLGSWTDSDTGDFYTIEVNTTAFN